MIKSRCDNCGCDSFYDFVNLDGETRKGCFNWDCSEVETTGVCYYEEELKDIVCKKFDFCGCGELDKVFLFI